MGEGEGEMRAGKGNRGEKAPHVSHYRNCCSSAWGGETERSLMGPRECHTTVVRVIEERPKASEDPASATLTWRCRWRG